MPYSIEKEGDDKWCVYNTDSGKKVGTHDSRMEAMKQMRALYASDGKAAKKPEKKSDKDADDEGDHEYR